jgi:thiosulfate/3-mercaptopyruvate sulfurtransferase
MAFTTLIDTCTLAGRIQDPRCAIVDCRFALDDPSWGERAYAIEHIPGAVYAHLDRDLSGDKTGRNGRHPLPTGERLREVLSGLGVARDVQIVAYDQDSGMFASRLWWLARWLGHEAVAVLDGGFGKWKAEGHPTRTGRESRSPRVFEGEPRADAVLEADAVAAVAGLADWRLIDVRAPDRFRGDVEPIDRIGGHIPGAVNYFYRRSLDAGGTFRSRDELRHELDSVLRGMPANRIVTYCGSGVTACHALLALEHAGFGSGRLYAGSWSEWSSDPARAVATGVAEAGSDPPPRARDGQQRAGS